MRQSLVLSLGWGRHGQPATREDIRDALAAADGERPSRSLVARIEREAIAHLRSRVRDGLFWGGAIQALDRSDVPVASRVVWTTAASPSPRTPGVARQSAFANQIVETLEDLQAPLSVTMLTHLMRGSSGPATSELVRRYSPRHFGELRMVPFSEARDQVEGTCRADTRIEIVARRVSLIDGGTAERRDIAMPANHGKSWSREDELAVERGWVEGRSVEQLALALKRTRGGVTAALVRLGVIDSRDEARQRLTAEAVGMTT